MATPPSETEEPPTALDEAERLAAMLVAQGFDGYADIVDTVLDIVDPEADLDDEQVESIVARRWRARYAEQAGWPETLDCDRLDEAFKTLRMSDLTVYPHFSCCLNCGIAEITEMADDIDRGLRGWVFYHEQDTGNALKGLGLYLAFGVYSGGDDAVVAIGREVVARLETAGLSADWDGDPASRIHVTPFVWRRRLLPDDGPDAWLRRWQPGHAPAADS